MLAYVVKLDSNILYEINPCGLYYKTFYTCNRNLNVISLWACYSDEATSLSYDGISNGRKKIFSTDPWPLVERGYKGK
jgi:hypothetical protein